MTVGINLVNESFLLAAHARTLPIFPIALMALNLQSIWPFDPLWAWSDCLS